MSRFLWPCACWLLISACSGSTFVATVDAGLSVDQACGDNATANCARLQACSPTDVQIRYGDPTTCVAREKANCVNALAAPSNGNNPSRLEGCAQAYAAWTCTDFLNTANIPHACQQATGALASGAACAFPGQCSTGFCAIQPGLACGFCAAPPAAGSSCAALTTCGMGFTCTTDEQTCAVFAAMGAACGAGAPCGAGLSCVGSVAATSTPGTCQTAVAQLSAPCDATQRTAAGCDRNQGLTCNGTSKQCATLAFAAGGQPCNDVSAQSTPCAAGGQCSTTASGMMGTCAAAASDGTACDLVNGPPCLSPARCVVGLDGGTGGTCQLPDASHCG